jgi:DNA excision repair protein ERCC-2
VCPYFLARRFLLKANIIVFNYSYMLDPKIANIVTAELQKESIIIFDECHNMDNVCIESFSLTINNRLLDQASSSIKSLEKSIEDEGKLKT